MNGEYKIKFCDKNDIIILIFFLLFLLNIVKNNSLFFCWKWILYYSSALMKPVYNAVEYSDSEKVYLYSNQVTDDINLEVYIQIWSEKFVDYQKEIFDEFVADFVDEIKSGMLSADDVEKRLEKYLQGLNSKLQAFAEKLRNVPKCDLKWYVQLIIDNAVKTWMIWKVSMVIFRDDKIYSVLENSYNDQASIDQFSDFIGWDLERGDSLLYVWTKLSDVLDQHDLTDIEWVLEKEDAMALLDFLDDLFSTRIDKKEVWFIGVYTINKIELKKVRSWGKLSWLASKYTSKITWKISSKVDLMKWKKKTNNVLNGNKYYVMVWCLVLAILFLVWAIFTQMKSEQQNKIQYQTSTWSFIDLTIDWIKQDIFAFKTLDPTSNEKSEKYNEISQKIQVVEANGLWVEDAAKLKVELQQAYEEGFMVRIIKNLSQFDDEKIGKKTKIFTFNSSEKDALGNLVSIAVDSSVNVWWEDAALIWIVNDSTRVNPIPYNMWEPAKACSLSLSKRWLFCYTAGWDLFFVNKLWIEPMEVVDGDWSTSQIWGIWTYGNNKFYLFQKNLNNMANALLTRYAVVPASENKYRNPSTYSVVAASWTVLPQELNWFAIDGKFLAWWDGNLYQFWRGNSSATTLEMRTVDIEWWDKTTLSPYSNNVKVLASDDSPYVFLFDKDNQTLTAYESSPAKTHENYSTSYKLYYMFRFKFALETETVIDAAVPTSTADRPELYLLSTDGVNKINIYEFIDAYKENRNRS